MTKTHKLKTAIIMAVLVALGSQVFVSLFIDGFIITFAVVILGVFMFRYNKLNPLLAGLIVGIVSPLFRFCILYFKGGSLEQSFNLVFPDVFFYIAYGLIFYIFLLLTKRSYDSRYNYGYYFIAVSACDFLSNIVEILVRQGSLASNDILSKLLFIAIGRTVVVISIIATLDAYNSLLRREEHQERYKRLMIMTSIFRSEVYFMQKNMADIEEAMKKAFILYRDLEKESTPPEIKLLALDVSKSIHEIKKGYISVIKGLSHHFLKDFSQSNITMRDVLSILSLDISDWIKQRKLDTIFTYKCRENFSVNDHFSLMSIIRNLVLNSLDSLWGIEHGTVRIDVFSDSHISPHALISPKLGANVYMASDCAYEEIDSWVISIVDNGSGIGGDDLGIIFNPGYSTKFDEDTGDIYRGVGLSIVRDLVCNKFKGHLSVESKEGFYTKFLIRIPKENLEAVDD